jgi:EpsD family peptidyl-prolyl cis-trans isomerase
MLATSRFSYRAKQICSVVALTLALAISACNKSAPDGQTAATVNGEAITQSELNFELGESGVPAANWKQVQPQLLQALIDRKLVIQAAKREGVDKQPETVLAEERAKEMVLANRALLSVATRLRRPPSAGDIETYLASHPGIGSERRILSVEQIRFPMPGDAAIVAALRPAKTMADLAQVLSDHGIVFQRSSIEIDSAGVDEKARRQLVASANGEPVIALDGSTAIANHLIGMRPADAGATATFDFAKQRLGAEQVEKGLRQRQATLRSEAKIEYAKDLAPKGKTAP